MSLNVTLDYLCIGGNRQSAASTYCADIQCLAYGADQNIALWRPLNDARHGVHQLLQGHNDKVTAVAFASRGSVTAENTLVSGAADGILIIWSLTQNGHLKRLITNTKGHKGAVNVIATSAATSIFVTGGADMIINFWKLQDHQVSKVATVDPNPRFIPLALAIGAFPNSARDQGFFLAAAGTSNDIHVYSVSSGASVAEFACSLTGHEGWIRSLALRKSNRGYLLASTSADKYTRLWKFQLDISNPRQNGHIDKNIPGSEQTLTGKVKSVGLGEGKLFITFEALLLGHEDWVYSADWQIGEDQKLLTASADGTLAIWEPDPTSGIWVSEARLGEISGQKGATTATGSSGGFWTGKWIGDSTVISLGRTGSWRIWQYNAGHVFWDLKPGIGGHIYSVNGLCWSPAGDYLLTTSSDQTTRLHAEWRREGKRSWHEFSRCQIHGYNCNVVACISSHQFVSGADEKLLRVFNEPKEMAETLHRLCRIELPKEESLPETAAIPVLGLSNKEMGEPDDIIEAGPRKGDEDHAAANALAGVSIKGITAPPTEDLLSRHTLWPEREKLYGHGYEISEAAYSSGILATACKASSIDHAMIRLYDPDNGWRQIEPPLAAHSLTVTRLAWSPGSLPALLSVGRDRQWSLFKRGAESKTLNLFQTLPKAHARMILDAAFSPSEAHNYFLTAGRDKTVKIWGRQFQYAEGSYSQEYALFQTIARPAAVTAIAVLADPSELNAVVAVGEENGTLSIHIFDTKEDLRIKRSIPVDKQFCLSKAINRLAWRPPSKITNDESIPGMQLAAAGADGSVRILTLDILAVCEELSNPQ